MPSNSSLLSCSNLIKGSLDRDHYLPAASSITLATLFGCDNITTCLEERTVAFIFFAMLCSCSGAIILSMLATMYQAGFSCHAAEAGLALKMDPAVGGWTDTSSAFSSLVRSGAKSYSIPGGESKRKPSARGTNLLGLPVLRNWR